VRFSPAICGALRCPQSPTCYQHAGSLLRYIACSPRPRSARSSPD